MKRELQPTLKQSGMGCGLYLICGQMIGQGLSHSCTVKNKKNSKTCSTVQEYGTKQCAEQEKANLSVLVGGVKNEVVK